MPILAILVAGDRREAIEKNRTTLNRIYKVNAVGHSNLRAQVFSNSIGEKKSLNWAINENKNFIRSFFFTFNFWCEICFSFQYQQQF